MGKRKRIKKDPCVYCGSTENITADHVPPKCLFPNLPNNLITVPACQDCNASYMKDDEYFRICVLAQPEPTQTGWRVWEQRVLGRSLKRSPRLKKHLLDNIIKVELRSSTGIYMGEAEALRFQEDRIDRVIKRIVKALYWHHYKQNLPEDISFVIRKDPDLSGLTDLIDLNNTTNLCPVVKEVFQYRYAVTSEDPNQSIWLLRFYETTTFLIITGREMACGP